MNKKRRNEITSVIIQLQSCANNLEYIKDTEDEARENMPENLQDSDAYRHSDDCSDVLMDAIENISGVINELETIT